jgi:hypothetical protein
MYTEQEVTNIQNNKSTQLASIIVDARYLAKELKDVKWGKENKPFQKVEEMIIRGFCTIYMAHMDESDFEEMLTNTLAYFATGLYDCEKLSGIGYGNAQTYNVCGWRYTPETHNDAGYWFDIWEFEKDYDAEKCVAMLKAIGAELEKLHNNY